MLGDNATHANYSVDDIEKAKEFYTNILGFTVDKQNDYGLVLKSGAGTKINIYQKNDHKAWESTILGIEVDDVHDAVADLVQRGVSVEKLDGTDDQGVLSDPEMGEAAWFKDPAGNWICISNVV